MYTDFYGLTGRPFQLTPDPRFYVDTATHRKAMAYLSYGLSQSEGFIVITGEVGAGKTMLVGRLMETIDRSKLVAAKIVTTQVDAGDMLSLVANAFGVPTEGLKKAEILTRLEAVLRNHHREGRRALLVVDEAQNLPIPSLEELRMLSNFQEGNEALLQTFLLGQPEFRDRLATSPELEQLRQRVIASHHLEPMGRDELPDYIRARLRLCGWTDDPAFTAGAFDAMYRYSGGVPRRLNNLAARILLFGALEERHVIDEFAVNEVAEDMKRDTAPGQPASTSATGGPEPKSPRAGAGAGADVARRLAAVEKRASAHDEAIRALLKIVGELGGSGK